MEQLKILLPFVFGLNVPIGHGISRGVPAKEDNGQNHGNLHFHNQAFKSLMALHINDMTTHFIL